MLIAFAIFLFTLVLVIWQPRGLGIGWSASIGALLALALGSVAPATSRPSGTSSGMPPPPSSR